ncbi:DUF2155 domain-containing protein [Acidisphaera sp. L21]|uniref:DUF2155 domain-containing protein n=1 Tax=Acidisphaera sp. L21 TaxID=1641851 RepID=UPI00131C905A|nr:DUF2155 domain-containing protein [Acidisphaera sp. L21]
MRVAMLAAFVLAATAAVAQTPAPTPSAPSGPGSWLSRDTADLLVLDKVNAKSTAVTLKVGQAADNASLSISLRACSVRPPDQPIDSAAYLDIKDSRAGAPGFHGWMFANEPAVNMLEHPVYDVRLVACH